MKKFFYSAALVFCGLACAVPGHAQDQSIGAARLTLAGQRCGTMEALAAQLKADPGQAQRMAAIEAHTQRVLASGALSANRSQSVVVIPVVVHVVYNTDAENISDAQVQSQIDVLNEDYQKLNKDAKQAPAAFLGLEANTGVQFVLAKRDPLGNPSSGIVRTQTKTTSFSTNNAVKYTKRGGDNAWPADSYLNMWACNLGQNLLGYAQFPGGSAATDGVVILYSAFGRVGTLIPTYNLGRTATHEVGHWLNLRHIWGDATCGNDYVADTPTQQTSNFGCPTYPHITCSNQGDMSMNYMDYTDDKCMYMFSQGQSARMNALFATGGARVPILSSLGAAAPRLAAAGLTAYPNPASDVLTLTLPAGEAYLVKVYDLRGYEMKNLDFKNNQLQVSQLPKGLYYLNVSNGRSILHQRFRKD